ncbi:unnamed protein product [Brachionus calyciflorus]|uniref:Uncharacterized protein n=1 Tax=Brachionus calyciflorus TaxID=104777 RepID=A0A813M292_9BILA|nr:unnamed protein product [Brachionus calyciflorus]
MKTIVLIILVQLGIGTCLFIRDIPDVVFLKDLEVLSQISNSYADNFKISLNEFNKNLKAEFVKVSNYGLPIVSYFSNGHLEDINLKKNHQTYRDQNGRGFATLFSKDGQVRMCARFYDDDTESNYYDIIPGNNRNKQGHFLHKRILDTKTNTKNGLPSPSSAKELKVKAETVSFFGDELHPPKKNFRQLSKENIIKPNVARAVNGIPLNIDVEILAVADPTIYNDHKMLVNTEDEMTIFEQIGIYYAHVFNGTSIVPTVNQEDLLPMGLNVELDKYVREAFVQYKATASNISLQLF